AAGRFREDLFYRLSVVPVRLPPLHDRKEDISLLASYYFEQFRQRIDARAEGLMPETVAYLVDYEWPGNVRELKNVIERMLVLHGKNPYILPEHLPDECRPDQRVMSMANEKGSLAESVNNFERQLIQRALERAGGVQTRAADALGTTRRILKYRMEKLDIANGGALNGGHE
ncbi:MAG: sigma-54-dependent Fis family transcriptional regulator, partial [Verrucomicrobia bacterium]|nr:sigma-54-dependent Fis family transcriptional regulator [Verrucomicrobiota bacterium]